MKKPVLLIAAALTAIAFVEGCSKSSEDVLSPQNSTNCDTVNMTYSKNIVPILKANCYSCHGNGEASGGENFEEYSHVKQAADNGSLLGTITHAPGYPPMPQGAVQLSECDINTIRAWINRGSLNN